MSVASGGAVESRATRSLSCLLRIASDEHSWSLPTNVDHENILEFYSVSSSPPSALCGDHRRLPRTALLVRAACSGLFMPLEDLE